MSNEEHGHVCNDTCHHDSPVTAPKGEAAHGWVWIIGIIVVVAIILFLLQSNVPDVAAPAQETPAAEETVPSEESTAPSDTSATSEPATPNASDSVRLELEGNVE